MATRAFANAKLVKAKTAAAVEPQQQTALLFDRFEFGADPSGNSAQAVVMAGPFAQRALVLANAWGSSRYEGPSSNGSGILLTLNGGTESVEDDSTEAKPSKVTFHTQASLMFVLPARESREVDTSISPQGTGGVRNKDTIVKLHVICIAV